MKGAKGSNKRTLLSSRTGLKSKNKSPLKHASNAKKRKLDAQTEILRNTAINSFRVDEKPTNQLILVRMQELKERERKQKEIAACHNLMLRMRQLLPVFNEEEDGDYIEEDDDDFEINEEDEEDEEAEGGEQEDEDDEEEEEDEEEEQEQQDEETVHNGTVEDLDELGDDESYGKRPVGEDS